jgi:glycosyltransferase involved in cell wall biosynthesis
MKPVYVCLPVYNGEGTIRSAIASVLNQEFTEFTLIVYDDGSTDWTTEIVEKLRKKDSRVRLECGNGNRGRGYARNRLLELAQDGIVSWQDADDRWNPTKLTQQLQALAETRTRTGHDNFVLLSTYLRRSLRGGGKVSRKCSPPELYDVGFVLGSNYHECPFQLQAVIGPASVFRDGGGFDEALNWAEDLDMALKLLRSGCKIYGHRTDHALAIYNHSLAKAAGPVVEAAQAVLRDRFAEFAAENGFDLDRILRIRAANYISRIYLKNGNYGKALRLNLQALISIDPSDERITQQIATNILQIVREHVQASVKEESGVAAGAAGERD